MPRLNPCVARECSCDEKSAEEIRPVRAKSAATHAADLSSKGRRMHGSIGRADWQSPRICRHPERGHHITRSYHTQIIAIAAGAFVAHLPNNGEDAAGKRLHGSRKYQDDHPTAWSHALHTYSSALRLAPLLHTADARCCACLPPFHQWMQWLAGAKHACARHSTSFAKVDSADAQGARHSMCALHDMRSRVWRGGARISGGALGGR